MPIVNIIVLKPKQGSLENAQHIPRDLIAILVIIPGEHQHTHTRLVIVTLTLTTPKTVNYLPVEVDAQDGKMMITLLPATFPMKTFSSHLERIQLTTQKQSAFHQIIKFNLEVNNSAKTMKNYL